MTFTNRAAKDFICNFNVSQSPVGERIDNYYHQCRYHRLGSVAGGDGNCF